MLDRLDRLPLDLVEALNPESLNLILFVTEQCNFRCNYCYEDFALPKMSEGVVSGVKSLISKRIRTLKRLDISWFGGEPLMAKSVIDDICQHILSERTLNPDLRFTSNMTSNGYLLSSDYFQKLGSYGLESIQISLDGTPEDHNKSRIRADGAGTFNKIWERLLAIRDETTATIQVILRVHFQADTWERLAPLVDLINSELSNDTRFVVYFKAIEQLGSDTDHKIRTLTYRAQAEVKDRLDALLFSERMIYNPVSQGRYICYASKANSFAVRSDGTLAKCTVGLRDPRNSIGYLDANGDMHIDQNLLRLWLKGIESNNNAVLACPYKTMQNVLKRDDLREELASK